MKSLCFGLLLTVSLQSQAMFKMDYEIKIGTSTLKGIESVTIDSSAELLSDQCVITLPGMSYNKAFKIEDKIKRGDKVSVFLGYDGYLRQEFSGYLKSIHPNTPMKLECEDSIFLFRKDIASKQFKKTTVPDLLAYVVEQINKQLPEQKIKLVTDVKGLQYDKFTIVRSNGYEVLEKIKQEFGVAIYCRNNELHCHLLYSKKTGDVTYDFARNVEESDGLEYVKADDVKMQIKIVGRSKKGEKISAEAGQKGGDVRTIQLPNVTDKTALEIAAKQQLKKLSYDGYKGSIKGWLIPACELGYSAKVIDKDYPEREGKYYVKSVKTEFSPSGGRRTVTLGPKVSV